MSLVTLTWRLLVLAGPLAAPVAATDDELAARLASLDERIEAARVELHIPGCAIAVVKDDVIVHARGFGLADLENGTPVTKETLFAIGSSTKAFTASLVGMMVDEGALTWDDAITDSIPAFTLKPEAKGEVTVTLRDLLSHQTGFARMGILWGGGDASRELIFETAAKAQPIDDFRGTFHYNNVMYLAAGVAAGVAADCTWEDLMYERLLEPLGMDDATLSITDIQEDERLALGYRWDEEKEVWDHLPMRNLDVIGPAGSVNAHVLDMAQWVRFQLAGGVHDGTRLLSEAQHQETWRQQVDAGGVGYGLGWILREWHGGRVVEHGGNIDGFAAEVALLPDEQLGFVLLCNVTATYLQTKSMAIVWESMLASPEDGASAPTVDYAPYLGRYHANFGPWKDAFFTVQEKNGRLALDIPGNNVFELRNPDGQGRWVFAITDANVVEFEKDADGDILRLRLIENGAVMEFPREGVEMPLEVDLVEVRPLLGKYHDAASDQDMTVLIQNGRLAVDVPSQMVFELEPPDEDGARKFRMVATIQVRFVREGDNPATAMFIKEAGKERELPRVEGDDEAPALPTIDELVAKRAARQAAIDKLGGMRIAGRVGAVNAGVKGTLEVLAGPGRYRIDIDYGVFGSVQVAVRDDHGGSRASNSPSEEFSGERLALAHMEHPLALLGDWSAVFRPLAVLRTDTWRERATWVVSLACGDEHEVTAWVDQETGDVLRLNSVVPMGVFGDVPTETRFSDFREVDGVRLPFRSRRKNPHTGSIVQQVESVEFGVEVADGEFELE